MKTFPITYVRDLVLYPPQVEDLNREIERLKLAAAEAEKEKKRLQGMIDDLNEQLAAANSRVRDWRSALSEDGYKRPAQIFPGYLVNPNF